MYSDKITHMIINFRNGAELKLPIREVDIKANNYDRSFKRQTAVGFGTSSIYNFVYINLRADFHMLREVTHPTAIFQKKEKINPLERILTKNDIFGVAFYNNEDLIESFGVPWPANITEGINKVLVNPLQANRVNDVGDVEIMIATNLAMKENQFNIDCYQRNFTNLEVIEDKWIRIFNAENM